jgi:uncharacterized protein YqjF (DUF2071 family)
MTTANSHFPTLSDLGKHRFETTSRAPLLVSDWMRTAFLHFEVEPEALAPYVPFELDLRDGKAYVTLVAFDLERLRPRRGGRVVESIGEALMRPISDHGFLNVRTYVRRGADTGIFFLREWLANRLSVKLGPPLYGLPYRYGRLDYQLDGNDGHLAGRVEDSSADGAIVWSGDLDADTELAPAEPGTLDEFLLERYTAFTERGGVERLFRVWHEPWPQTRVEIDVDDLSLLRETGDWIDHARFVGANWSPGVRNVWVGEPERLR